MDDDLIPVWRREFWHKKSYYKPKNLLSQIEQAAAESSSSSSSESEAAQNASSAAASSEMEIRPVGLNQVQQLVDQEPSSSSSSVLEVDTHVSLSGGSTEECDQEVRDILNMETLEASTLAAEAGTSHDAEREEGEISGTHDGGDDDLYNLDSPPFHMIDADDDTILMNLPYVLYCGRCSAPNSIRHIYDKFEVQLEQERTAAAEAAEQVQQQRQQEGQREVQQHQDGQQQHMDQDERGAGPPNYSLLFPANLGQTLPPSTPPAPPSSPVSYSNVAPPPSFTPMNAGSGSIHMMFLSPSDNHGTPSNNLTANCFVDEPRDGHFAVGSNQDEKEEGELSSDED